VSRKAEFKAARLRAWSRYLTDKSDKNLENLLRAYEPMIGYIAHDKFGGYKHVDLDDIKQWGMIGVLTAIRRFNPKKVRSADAYVAMVAKGRMYNYFDLMHNRVFEKAEEFNPDIGGVFERDLDAILDLRQDLCKLTSREYTVIILRYGAGWQLQEIADHLNCTKPNVWYIEKQALKKLKT
jgi:RNA polymerase sigma factor (sigma-70 family)